MKITVLKRKITISLVIAAVLFTGSVAAYVFSADYLSKLQTQKNRIDSETSRNNSEITDVKNKAIEVKRYLGLWDKISDNKKITSGIKMDDVNLILDNLSRKHSIAKHKITVALPQELDRGVFKRTTISTLHTVISLDFNSIKDTKALAFITDFINNLPGYAVIDRFSLEKERSYEIRDLVQISAGNGSGVINGEVTIFWYAFKEKEDNKAEKTPAPIQKNKK